MNEPILTKYHYDESNDRLFIERIQDTNQIVDINKKAANSAQTNWRGDLHHVASIPLVLIEKYKNEFGIDLMNDKEALKRFLNDPDNKFLRTKPGKV
jgi:hypothetical protein